MDALRPSAAVISREQNQSRRSDPRVSFSGASNSTAQTFSLASPNSFAPPIGSRSTASTLLTASRFHQSTIFVAQSSKATTLPAGGDAPDTTVTLPAFLSRRTSHSDSAAQRTATDATSSCAAADRSGNDAQDAEPLRRVPDCDTVDDDDDDKASEATVDENRFYENLDEDDGGAEETEESLMQAAEEISAAAGMTHAEALALLLEHHKEKAQRRKERCQDVPRRVTVRRPSAAPDGVFALTGTPLPDERTCEPVPVSSSHGTAATTDAVGSGSQGGLAPTPRGAVGVEESNGARSQRLLAELFPDGCGCPRSAPDDEVEDFRVARAKRLTEKHQRVVEHLQTKRGVVPTPKSLVQQTPLVRAFELEMMKRSALKELKEEMLRRQARDAEEERRLKGAKSNLAIQQRIRSQQATEKREVPALKGKLSITSTIEEE